MKITMERTDVIKTIEGVPVRLWQGVREDGAKCQVFVRLIVTEVGQEAELPAIPERMVI